MDYIFGFAAPVPADKREAYLAHAREAAPMFREFGAARLVECWGDDVPDGKVTDFKRAVAATDDEVVVFGWFEYPDKAACDEAHQKMENDPRMAAMGQSMPFDGKRMIFGAFETIVDTGADTPGGYMEGFLLAVPEANRDAYTAIAKEASEIFREHGALRVVEAWDVDVPEGKLTDMRRAVKAEFGEKIVFSWIEWPDKATRQAGMKAVSEDPRMRMDKASLPFDGMRVIFGGFEVLLDS